MKELEPIPTTKKHYPDKELSEEFARQQFKQNADKCLKPCQIIDGRVQISWSKPSNFYQVGWQY